MIAKSQPAAANDGWHGPAHACPWRSSTGRQRSLPAALRRPAFTLMELMIGIIILGLGMVMVATMFPVAWDRARTLNEQTIQQTVVANAHATVKSLVRVSSPSAADASSFLGDLNCNPDDLAVPVAACSFLGFASDTWVHALNMENIQIVDRRFVPPRNPPGVLFEDGPWRLEAAFSNVFIAELYQLAPNPFFPDSFFRAQVRFHQQVYPPVGRRQNVDVVTGEFTGDDHRWDEALDARRFCWAVFHRLREQLSGDCTNPQARGATRSFDLYYVTLRRPRPTFRYARQDPDPTLIPNPCLLDVIPVIPAARPADEDVMFPVQWRVQVQFPDTLLLERDPTTGLPNPNVTGIPTEIQVPPPELTNADARAMLVGMFPVGAQFIDEITGEVYKVVKRRVTGPNEDLAFLTLDREVYLEDIDLPEGDERCVTCQTLEWYYANDPPPRADLPELLRTVWVFPPPVEPGSMTSQEPRNGLTFAGSQPVVGIDIRTLNISPSG